MPKGFTDSEREQIRQKLLDTGRDYFRRFGLKKTNIAELTREAGIAKGSFYMFFDSKEELFMDVLTELGDRAHDELLEQLESFDGSGKAVIRKYFDQVNSMLVDEPLLAILTDSEVIQQLVRKVPREKLKAHFQDDLEQAEQLLAILRNHGAEPAVGAPVLSSAGRALFSLSLHKDLIGPAQYDEVYELFVDGLVHSILPNGGKE